MTSYVPCAGSPISLAATADTTGLNTGNLTNAFTVNVLGTMPPVWEWYRCVIAAPTAAQQFAGGTCNIYVDQHRPLTTTTPAFGGTEWDPSQPIQLRQGNELFFFWQLASSVTPVPYVTLFLRYDADLAANQSFRG